MAYGYFGITLVILVVAGIFLLVASDGDIDLDISLDGVSEGLDKLGEAVGSAEIDVNPHVNVVYNHMIMDNAYYAFYLASVLEYLSNEDIQELNRLEKEFRNGAFTIKEYERKLNKFKRG